MTAGIRAYNGAGDGLQQCSGGGTQADQVEAASSVFYAKARRRKGAEVQMRSEDKVIK